MGGEKSADGKWNKDGKREKARDRERERQGGWHAAKFTCQT